jgi:YHS domain-containing protein
MKHKRRDICVRMLTGVLAMASAMFAAAEGPVNKDAKGVAVKGYDVIAYFDEKRPVKGTEDFKFEYQGATYLFASAAHRDLFSGNPDKYLPQYGGYCAYGMAKGHKAPVDPEAWSVVDGRLYLNYSVGVSKDFAKDRAQNIQEADKNWPKLR